MGAGPTGQQHELRHGDQQAVVVEVGGGLRRYTSGGSPVVDGYGGGDVPDGARGQVLVPWPNRIRDGRYRWEGRDLQLPLTEREAGNAIHGLLRWTSWSLRRRDESRVVLGATVWPQPGYPFRLDVEAAYAVGADGLSVRLTARNDGSTAAPYGVGQHPYVKLGDGPVDDYLLTIPAGCWFRTDDRGTPVAAEPVAGSPYDFRTPRAIGTQRIDTAYGDLRRDDTGRVVVRVEHSDRERGVDVWLGDGADYVQVFTGDTLADPGRRRRALAVEPMSCPPDAFRSGRGLVALSPGETHELRWGLSPWSTTPA